MKFTVETQDSIVKSVKAEYTPAEVLVLYDALNRYAEDREMNTVNRRIAQQILSATLVEEREGAE